MGIHNSQLEPLSFISANKGDLKLSIDPSLLEVNLLKPSIGSERNTHHDKGEKKESAQALSPESAFDRLWRQGRFRRQSGQCVT